jgi:hypothetical protein
MIRPLNLQIAIIVLLAMTNILAVRQARAQAMPGTARAAGVPADAGTAKAPDKQEAKSASRGSSKWTAGATSFASPDKGVWGSGHGFSSTPKAAWAPSSAAFSHGGAQPGGVWRTQPSLSSPEGATPTNSTEAGSVSAEPALSEMHPFAVYASPVSASRISKPATIRGSISGSDTHQSERGSRQPGKKPTMSAHQFGTPLQGRAGGKAAFGFSGQRRSFTANQSEGVRSMRRSQSGSVSAVQHGTTELGDRPGALGSGLGQPRLGSRLGGTGSGFDQNPWDPQLHHGQSEPQ